MKDTNPCSRCSCKALRLEYRTPGSPCVCQHTAAEHKPRLMTLIALERDEDVSGVSGTGRVAYGTEFPDGTIALRWDTEVVSTVFYASRADLEHIVSHGGRTRVVEIVTVEV